MFECQNFRMVKILDIEVDEKVRKESKKVSKKVKNFMESSEKVKKFIKFDEKKIRMR